jgi:hypothetical protein
MCDIDHISVSVGPPVTCDYRIDRNGTVLAANHPAVVFNVDLATSLNNLSTRLSDLRRRDDALEARRRISVSDIQKNPHMTNTKFCFVS